MDFVTTLFCLKPTDRLNPALVVLMADVLCVRAMTKFISAALNISPNVLCLFIDQSFLCFSFNLGLKAGGIKKAECV